LPLASPVDCFFLVALQIRAQSRVVQTPQLGLQRQTCILRIRAG